MSEEEFAIVKPYLEAMQERDALVAEEKDLESRLDRLSVRIKEANEKCIEERESLIAAVQNGEKQ